MEHGAGPVGFGGVSIGSSADIRPTRHFLLLAHSNVTFRAAVYIEPSSHLFLCYTLDFAPFPFHPNFRQILVVAPFFFISLIFLTPVPPCLALFFRPYCHIAQHPSCLPLAVLDSLAPLCSFSIATLNLASTTIWSPRRRQLHAIPSTYPASSTTMHSRFLPCLPSPFIRRCGILAYL